MRVMHRADNTAQNFIIKVVKDIFIYFENNVGVIVNVKGDEGFGDYENSKSRASRTQQNSSR